MLNDEFLSGILDYLSRISTSLANIDLHLDEIAAQMTELPLIRSELEELSAIGAALDERLTDLRSLMGATSDTVTDHLEDIEGAIRNK